MTQFGTGIIPNPGAVAAELNATVRRAFLDKYIVQIWKSSPLMCSLLSSALMASGGLSPITAVVQGNPMVSTQNTDYSGTFNKPGVIPGLQDAEFNLSAYVTPIPFLGFEGLVEVDYAVVPLIDARMNDATNSTIDAFSTDLWNNVTNQLAILGLPVAVDDGTSSSSYGGIARSSVNSQGTNWWQSTYVSNSAGAVTPTRNQIMQYVLQVTKKNGEMPKMGICGMGTWGMLTEDFAPQERYNVDSAGAYGDNVVRSLFQAVMIGGVPIYCDPYAPEGILYLLNTDYLSAYIHEKAGFQFTGFESTLPNGQFGYIGAILTLLQLVNVKPQAHGKFANMNFLNI
jgi:hypothetical protein